MKPYRWFSIVTLNGYVFLYVHGAKMIRIIAFIIIFIGTASAKSADEAEYDRLVSEMGRLSKVQSWSSVNSKFEELEELGLDIRIEEYLVGAQAAQEIGDIAKTKDRVSSALLMKEKRSIRSWYSQLDNNYGYVKLIAKTKGNRELSRVEPIMDPIQSRSIEYASDAVSSKGKFYGMLPVGEYSFGGQSFMVTADMSIHLEISPRLRKKMGVQIITEPIHKGE